MFSSHASRPVPHWATKMLCLITFAMAFGLAFLGVSGEQSQGRFRPECSRGSGSSRTATTGPSASFTSAVAQWPSGPVLARLCFFLDTGG